ncbi:hypothetical protein ABPG74_002832 [Tetrahymena malaccensis]
MQESNQQQQMQSESPDQQQFERQKELFGTVVNRMHSHCLKYDAISIFFPEYQNPEEVSCNWVGDMDFNVCPYITEGIQKRIKTNNIYGYPGLLIKYEPFLNSLISWCRRRHSYEVQPQQINITQNTLQTISTLYRLKCKKNEGIIIQTPIYYKIIDQATMIGRKVVPNPLIFKNGLYYINFELLEEQLADPNNKIMVFCNPLNPSGRVWTYEEVKRVAELCLKYDVFLISDEIFADLTLPGYKHTIAGSISNEVNLNTATIFTPSKAFNLSGLSISTVVIPNQDLNKQFTQKNNSQGFYYANIFGQIAYENAYSLQGELWLADLVDYIVKNYEFMQLFLKEQYPDIEILEMQAGYLTMLDFSKTNLPYQEIKQILINSNVLLEDLSDFFYPKQNTLLFRINIACPQIKLKECLEKIVHGFKSQIKN